MIKGVAIATPFYGTIIKYGSSIQFRYLKINIPLLKGK